MNMEATQQGASGVKPETPKQKAFPDPSQIRNQGVDNTDGNNDTADKPMSDRERIMADIEARVDAERMAKMGEMPIAEPEAEPEPEQEGLASREPMHPEPEQGDELPPEYADDPLAKFIVMDEENNTPMFVTKVDGQERYIPLEEARRQLQKQEAADARLRKASERQKELDAREAQIAQSEAELQARLAAQQNSPPSEPPAPDVSDQDLLNEAQTFVNQLFSGTADEASASLADLLANMRKLQGKQSPHVDPQELANTTAALVQERQRREAVERDARDGLEQFKADYPEILQNRALFLYADDMTDSIAEEWTIEGRSFTQSQVMLEAGKRTREWWNKSTGTKTGDPTPTPSPQPSTDRHARKRNLRPMPSSRSERLPQEVDTTNEPQDPYDVVAEMRRARGQG